VLNPNGGWKLTGGGGDIWGTADAFHYVWQTMAADGTLSADVTAQSNTDPFAKAGVMLRASTTPGAPYYAAFLTPGNGVAVQWRSARGATSNQVLVAGTAPVYLRVARFTDSRTSTTYYSVYTSLDGSNWSFVAGSTQVLSIPGALLAGMAVTSHSQGTAGQASFAAVRIATVEFPPPSYCPPPWKCADIGRAVPPGTQVRRNQVWTVQGGGGDIWGTADSFHFVWRTVSAGGSATGQVTSQTNTDPFAKAGVMLRGDSSAGSAYYAAFLTPGHGVAVQWRSAIAATSNQILATGAPPEYLRVAASSTTFTAYTSSDGVTWTPVAGSAVSIPILNSGLLAGMAVTSHSTAALSTVDLGSVTVQ
jgi:hypothetical protein